MSSFWLALRSGFGFLSMLPVGLTMEGIAALMEKNYLYPVIGTFLGILLGVIAYISQLILPGEIALIIMLFSIYYIVGFNHLDGVADLGDGMMAHGSLEKKLNALKDTKLGIGGAASCTILLISLYSSIAAVQTESLSFVRMFNGSPEITTPLMMFLSFIVMETCAKHSMLTIATFGKSIHEGLGSMTIDGATPVNFMIGTIFSGLICTATLGLAGLLALIASIIFSLVLLNRSNNHFGGLNGDGIGTANELGRIISLATIALTISFMIKTDNLVGLRWMLL